MARLVMLAIVSLATIHSGLGLENEVCPFDEVAVDNTGRRCNRGAACTGESDKSDCKGKRRCRCDDICGFVCIKVFQENFCAEDDLPPLTVGLTYELSRDPIRFNTTATYSCDTKYELSDASLKLRKCRGDQRWSGETPTCLTGVACTAPPKVNRTMHNGRDDNGNDRELYAVGERLKYSCNSGYYQLGNGYIYCEQDNNTATWSELDPSFACKPKSCGSPGTVSNGYRDGNVFTFSEEVLFYCNEGYKIQGRNYRVCQADGEWSGYTPVCIPVPCPSLTDPENGEIFGMEFTYGKRVKLDCDVGFVVSGTNGSMSEYVRCQANGQWDLSVQCEAVNCGNPGVPVNGNRNGDDFGYNGYILFACDADYLLVGEKSIYCKENNKWSAERPLCLGKCVLPTIPTNLDVSYTYSVGDTVAVGTKYRINCRGGYTLNSDTDIWECIGGQMSFDPVCTENSCPRPEAIQDGSVAYSSDPVSGLYSPNTIATYSCNDGFKLSTSGSKNRRCRNGKFKGTAPTCSATVCTTPTVQNSQRDTDNPILEHDESVTYTCNDGYYSEDDLTLTCWNEEFNNDPPVCQEEPCPGISSDHLQVVYVLSDTTSNGLYEAGTVATFSCNPDDIYYASVPSATCQSGQFKPQVTCKQYATCPDEEVENGLVSYKDDRDWIYTTDNGLVRQGITRNVRCSNPYVISGKSESVCGSDGRWTNQKPSCQNPTCVIPNPPKYGEFVTALGVGYTITYPNKVRLHCNSPNSKIVGTSTYECNNEVLQVAQCVKRNEFNGKNICRLHQHPKHGWFSYSNSLKPGSKIRIGCHGLNYMQTIPGFERTCVQDTNPSDAYNYRWSPDISEVPECILDIDFECRREVVRGESQPFTASSSGSGSSPADGRLYEKQSSGVGAWIPGKQTVGEWLEVDLGQVLIVYGVKTQGNYFEFSWVTLYKVAYRKEEDASQQLIVQNENGEDAIFVGNVDRRTPSQQVFPEAVRARYVRIYPREWYQQISLRFGVVACKIPAEELACQVPQVENSILYVNTARSVANVMENFDTIYISCNRGHTFDNGDSGLLGECRNAEIVFESDVVSLTCEQTGPIPSQSTFTEEEEDEEDDCGMPTINEDTIVNVNYRYDLDDSTPLDTKFPSGTELITRCLDIGKYVLDGERKRVCLDGSWIGSPATCQWSANRLRFIKYLNYNQLPRQVAPNSTYIMNTAEVARLTVECTVTDDAELRFEPFTGRSNLDAYGDNPWGSSKIYYVIKSPEHSGLYSCWDKDSSSPPMKLEIRVVDPIYCPPPPILSNGQIYYTSIVNNQFPLNAKLTYTCHLHNRLVGERELKCLYDGLWDFQFPHCISLTCDSPPSEVQHAFIIGSGTTQNSEIGIYCESGFHIPGTDEQKLKSVCTEGKWVPPLPSTCIQPTVCEDLPPDISNGFVLTDDTNGRSVTIICNKNAIIADTTETRMTIRCVDGEWDHSFPSACIGTEPQCPTPPVTVWYGIVRRQNNTITLTCDDGYYIPGTSEVELIVTCVNAEWDDDFPVACTDSPGGVEDSQSFFSSSTIEISSDGEPSVGTEPEPKIKFCNATLCSQENWTASCKSRTHPVVGMITQVKPVSNSTDLEVSIDISTWLKESTQQTPSNLVLTVDEALIGDCYCPAASLNTDLLIFLRYRNGYKLVAKSYISEDTTSLPDCQ